MKPVKRLSEITGILWVHVVRSVINGYVGMRHLYVHRNSQGGENLRMNPVLFKVHEWMALVVLTVVVAPIS